MPMILNMIPKCTQWKVETKTINLPHPDPLAIAKDQSASSFIAIALL